MAPQKRKDSEDDKDMISKLLRKMKMDDDEEEVDHLIMEADEETCAFLEAALVESHNLANIKQMLEDVGEGFFLNAKEKLDVSVRNLPRPQRQPNQTYCTGD